MTVLTQPRRHGRHERTGRLAALAAAVRREYVRWQRVMLIG
jgi:hypothetical protein